jgi:hypothetical protein
VAWSKYGKVLVDAALAKRHGITAVFVLCVLALSSQVSSQAFAADMPVKAAPAQPACSPQYCSGFYVGANLIGVGYNIKRQALCR